MASKQAPSGRSRNGVSRCSLDLPNSNS